MPLQDQRLQNAVDIAMQVDTDLANAKTTASMLGNTVLTLQKDISDLQTKLAGGAVPSIFQPKVYPKLHLRPASQWARGADVAGLKGSFTIAPPNPDGSVTISVNPTGPYNNFYLYTNLESGIRNARVNKALQITEFEIGEEAIPFCEELETNFDHTLDNLQYNGGISPLLSHDKDRETGKDIINKWRWFNITPGSSGWYTLNEVPFDRGMFGTGKHVRIESEYVRMDNKMTHAAVTINGIRYEINRTSTAKPQPTWTPHIQHGFQIDTNQNPKPFSVKVWDMECRVL